MTVESLRHFLLWSVAVNYGVLFVWFFVLVFAKDWVRTLHRKWFTLADTTFDAIHYGAMAVYKVGILLLNVGPLVALWLMQAD